MSSDEKSALRRGSEGGEALVKREWSFKIPLAVALLAATVLIAGSISIPLGVLSFKGADKSIADVTDILRYRLNTEFKESVLKMLDSCFKGAEDTRDSYVMHQYLKAFTLDKTTPLSAFEQEFVQSLQQRAARYDVTQAVSIQKDGLGMDNYFVGKLEGFGKSCTQFNATHMSCAAGKWRKTGSEINSTMSLAAFFPPNTLAVPSVVSGEPAKVGNVKGIWQVGQFITLPGSTVPIGSKACQLHQWVTNPLPANGRGSDWDAEYLGVFHFEKVTEYLVSLKATPNTRMALIEANGYMMAANQANLHLNIAGTGGELLSKCNSSLLRAAGQHVLDTYGSYTNAPESGSKRIKTADGVHAFLDYVRLWDDDTGLDMVAFLVIPEDDLLATMKRSRRSAVISVSVVAAVMLAVAGFMSYLFTLPLSRLSNIMRAATNFDFSSVRDKKTASQRSFLREIAMMEDVFMTMLIKFAKAIEANKQLMGPTKVTSQGGSQQSQPRSPTTEQGEHF
ncbi:hypothetical protein DFJ77DRAFT_480779 [Powellomyces hirtus]|nr:hypothetical protein DFJ77DRAFT_480779 [Powellomyces hirtus]